MIEQHRHDSLKNACRAAQIAGNSLSDIYLPKWAETFGCTTDHVMEMWQREQSKLSRNPSNMYEEPAE